MFVYEAIVYEFLRYGVRNVYDTRKEMKQIKKKLETVLGTYSTSLSLKEAMEKKLLQRPMCIYAAVLHALGGMDKDILLIAQDDKLRRQMQIAYIKYAFKMP